MNPSDHPSPSSGGSESMEQIVDRFERPLLAYATRMLRGDRQSAQDAVQETFLRLCRADRSQIEERLAAWLFTVCRTRVIDMQRIQQKKPVAFEGVDEVVVDPVPTAQELACEGEENRRLGELIEKLSSRQQEVLRLRMQAGLSYREIAEATGLTVTNVGFHLHAAVRRLRTAFAHS